MNYSCDESVILFEHRFWLQILGDHSRFIFNSLVPTEAPEIEKACMFIHIFDQLLEDSRHLPAMPEIETLTEEALDKTKKLRCFKLHLLERHLLEIFNFHLPPTFLNHMVNELDEYLRILLSLSCGKDFSDFAQHSLHHDLLWLPDAVGHAGAIASDLDDVEQDLIETSHCFMKNFKALHEKALEFKGYLRTNLLEFPALNRLNCQVSSKMSEFMEFLHEIRELVCDKEALGTLVPLIPDHMLREECYFLIKLAEVANIPKPGCDPTRPRLE